MFRGYLWLCGIWGVCPSPSPRVVAAERDSARRHAGYKLPAAAAWRVALAVDNDKPTCAR